MSFLSTSRLRIEVFNHPRTGTHGHSIRLNPDVTLWMKNNHCELNYYMTQFLTGHGCFRKYLHRFGHMPKLCRGCEEEDAKHILTCCPRFGWRAETNLGPNGLMKELLNSRVLWSQYCQRMAEVMLELRRLEERRRNFN